MYRTHTCGELRLQHVGTEVTLAGWVQKVRKLGGMTFIDIRDRYGITQLVVDDSASADIQDITSNLGREFVINATGKVIERTSKNSKIDTGDVEIAISALSVLNKSDLPPFTIEDDTDGGDEIRMKYRYLDLRRNAVRSNMVLRHQIAFETRRYLDQMNFLEVETPILIGSTPEGARDFVVPSRMNPGQFYALPQSPQLFKQLLMVSGFDRYFQIAKCFRDEDLRADRQPEFTQIDCEMSFVEQEDVLQLFEGMMKHLFMYVKNVDFSEPFPRMTWHDAMKFYGSDKPDIRFEMRFVELKNCRNNSILDNRLIEDELDYEAILNSNDYKEVFEVYLNIFGVFNSAEYVGGICAEGCAAYTRKQIDELTEFVKRPQIGAKGLVYIRCEANGTYKSSVDKFYSQDILKAIASKFNAKEGDLILILAGDTVKTQKALCELRLEMGTRLGLRDKNVFKPLWVIDFPLFEWDEDTQRFYAMHHPFTSPKPEDIEYLDSDPGRVRANAYDMVVNGVELGGGSIRIHDSQLQNKMFELLGFTPEMAESQFGFLMNAFKYGAPPHGGLAFGLDRLVSLFAGLDSIRDCIAFPKNNSGRDVMTDAPSTISEEQLKELCLKLTN